MITDDQLRSIMPKLPAPKAAELLPPLNAAIEEFAIGSPARSTAFLAQLAHESGQFRFMEEIWGPTDAQRRYEPVSTLATRLGNTETGDGKRFKGRGPIQLTGRANYARFGQLLGVDLVANPPAAATPAIAFRIAGLFWSKKGLNELADLGTADAFKEITRRINGGSNGLVEREKFYTIAKQVVGVMALETRSVPRSRRELAANEPEFARGWESIRAASRRRPASGKKRTTAKKVTHKKKSAPSKTRAIKKARSETKTRTGRARTASKSRR